MCTLCLRAWPQRNRVPRVYKCPRVTCILCDTEKAKDYTRTVHAQYVGKKVKKLPLQVDAARARIRSIQDYVVQRGDRVCRRCIDKHARFLVYSMRDCSFAASRSHATETMATDARRTLLVAAALRKDPQQVLVQNLQCSLSNWDFAPQSEVTAPVGKWWDNVRFADNGRRLQRLETHAASHPAVAAALDVLKSRTSKRHT
mmetsp:Transcript_2808/g.10173  ORF Transcript_2808/g.10173 Transcript_2808/m.10173 type:complete len:201 (+) Transcript_2808:991-1593(+)